MDAKILDTIKKLLALAEDARGNESEMHVAMEKVHTLLSKYNLSLTEVRDHDSENSILSVDVCKTSFFDDSSGHMKHWKGCVWGAIARLYYGYVYSCLTMVTDPNNPYKSRRVTQYTIIAHKDNAEIAIAVVQFVLSQARSIANRECSRMGRSYKDSFLKGLAFRVSQRVDELIRQAKEGKVVSDGTALVRLDDLYDKYAVAQREFVKQLGVTIQTNTWHAKSRVGFVAGKKAGDQISLNRPVSSSPQTMLR